MYTVNMLKIFQPYTCNNLVRLGKDYDGGYLVNLHDVRKSNKLLSLGIGSDVSFEEHFTRMNNCIVDAYDESAGSHGFFDHEKHNLHLVNVGNKLNERSINDLLTEDDIFIKCDIEGAEYDIFESLITHSSRLSGLVIEVHSINDPANFNELLNFISKLDMKLIHVHVNNYFYYKTSTNGNIPDILELSFTSANDVRYDRSLQLPNTLDMPNNPNDEDFKICF